MMSLWDALRMNMMISYQELVRTFPTPGYAESVFSCVFSVPRVSFRLIVSQHNPSRKDK